MKNKSALLTVLKAMFVNKLRFGGETSTRKKRVALVSAALIVVAVLAVVMTVVYFIGGALAAAGNAANFYIMLLVSAAGFVLIFGIVSLVSTLFLSRDTDFYSTLPIKPSVVFLAKLLYVYISEAVIAVLILFPATIEFGIVAHITDWYYYAITLLSLAVVPALPLAAAAILAVPVMFIAGKFRNRSIVPLIFYSVLFFGFFSLYFYFVLSLDALASTGITPENAQNIADILKIIGYVMYPYTALSSAAFGIPMYGLSLGASAAVNLAIFAGSSAALVGVLMMLGKFMYSRSAKANNQTDNSKVKNGSFKTSGAVKALVVREYKAALRSTQVTVQCFIGYILVILFSVIFGFMYLRSSAFSFGGGDFGFAMVVSITMLMMPASSVAAMTTFSREGVACNTLKILPVTSKRIISAKAVAWSVFSIPTAVIAAVVINAFDFEAWRFFLVLLGFVLFAAVFTVFSVLWDVTSPKLKWTDPMQAIKHNVHQLAGMFIGMSSGLVLLIVSVLSMVFGMSAVALTAIFIGVIFGSIAIFAVVDILLYRKSDKYFNRIEI